MNQDLTRRLAIVQAHIHALDGVAHVLSDVSDVQALHRLRLEVGEYIAKKNAEGEIPANPLAEVSEEIQKIAKGLNEAHALYHEYIHLEEELKQPQFRSLTGHKLEDRLGRIREAEEALGERIQKVAQNYEGALADGAASRALALPESYKVAQHIWPNSPIHRLPTSELYQVAFRRGPFYDAMISHIEDVKERCRTLRAEFNHQLVEVNRCMEWATEGDYIAAETSLKNLKQVFNDIDYDSVTDVVNKCRSWLSAVTRTGEQLEADVLEWPKEDMRTTANPGGLGASAEKIRDRIRSFEQEIRSFRTATGTVNSSEFDQKSLALIHAELGRCERLRKLLSRKQNRRQLKAMVELMGIMAGIFILCAGLWGLTRVDYRPATAWVKGLWSQAQPKSPPPAPHKIVQAPLPPVESVVDPAKVPAKQPAPPPVPATVSATAPTVGTPPVPPAVAPPVAPVPVPLPVPTPGAIAPEAVVAAPPPTAVQPSSLGSPAVTPSLTSQGGVAGARPSTEPPQIPAASPELPMVETLSTPTQTRVPPELIGESAGRPGAAPSQGRLPTPAQGSEQVVGPPQVPTQPGTGVIVATSRVLGAKFRLYMEGRVVAEGVTPAAVPNVPPGQKTLEFLPAVPLPVSPARVAVRVVPDQQVTVTSPLPFATVEEWMGQDFVTTSGMKMIWRPGGYWISENPVSVRDYILVQRHDRADEMPKDGLVRWVNMPEARQFCERFTAREQASGTLPPEFRFFVSSEIEWAEYALRRMESALASGRLADGRALPVSAAELPMQMVLGYDSEYDGEWAATRYDEAGQEYLLVGVRGAESARMPINQRDLVGFRVVLAPMERERTDLRQRRSSGLTVHIADGRTEVVWVEEGSAAAAAGLLPGDQIMEIAGRRIQNEDQFQLVLRTFTAGMKVPIVVMRNFTERHRLEMVVF